MHTAAEPCFKKRVPCRLQITGGSHAGMVLNVSRGGLFVQTTAGASPGEAVHLELAPGEGEPLALDARVVWRRVVAPHLRTVTDREGRRIAMSRNGEIGVFDASGRERERHPVVYGAHVKVADGEAVKVGDTLLEWDPFANPILAEVGGRVKFGDIVEGSTMQEQVDEFTGLSSKTRWTVWVR